MSLQAIKDRRQKIDGAPWSYYQPAQNIMGTSRGGCSKEMSEYRVADIRGWGHLQYMGIERGDQVAQDMQDANGIFIANAPTDIDALFSEIDRLRRVLAAILQWPANWNAPWEAEEEWRGDLELAKAALRGDPE